MYDSLLRLCLCIKPCKFVTRPQTCEYKENQFEETVLFVIVPAAESEDGDTDVTTIPAQCDRKALQNDNSRCVVVTPNLSDVEVHCSGHLASSFPRKRALLH